MPVSFREKSTGSVKQKIFAVHSISMRNKAVSNNTKLCLERRVLKTNAISDSFYFVSSEDQVVLIQLNRQKMKTLH